MEWMRPRLRAIAGPAAVAVGLGAGSVVAAFAVESAVLRLGANGLSTAPGTPGRLTRRFDAPGLSRPAAVPAGVSGLADDEEIIGVLAGGQARAYRLRALEYPPWHIVNDVVGGQPVTVAHCDLTGCTRAFAGPPGGDVLDLAQAGVIEGEMVVVARGARYFHRTGRPLDTSSTALPYPDHEWVRMTWREWRQIHPETDVFAGLPDRGPH